MHLDELQGRTVVVVESAQNLGQVTDVTLDLASRQAIALLVTSGGLIGGAKHTLPVGRIHRIGRDAIMVQRADEANEGHDIPDGFMKLSDLKRKTVMTESGEDTGSVRDVEVANDYSITAIEVTTLGGLLGVFGSSTTVPVNRVISFGEFVVVQDAAQQGKQ